MGTITLITAHLESMSVFIIKLMKEEALHTHTHIKARNRLKSILLQKQK